LREIDQIAVEAKNNSKTMQDFISQNELFILRCASEIAHRYITKSDDEWSVSLLAFSEAIHNYSFEKGSFFSFAKMLILRRLIDYFRTQTKYTSEVSVSPTVFDLDQEDETDIHLKIEVSKKISYSKDDALKLEIEAANKAFSNYGYSFFDLTECSPKAEKTKIACAKAVTYLLKNPLLLNDIKTSKLLPIKIIEKNSKVPRKILERHRKYILAAIEIVSGDYPYLAEYMHFIREELDR
jgi:RNA polymerase sigma factor